MTLGFNSCYPHQHLIWDLKQLKTITFCPKKSHLIQASADQQNFFHFIPSEIKANKHVLVWRGTLILFSRWHTRIAGYWICTYVQFGMGTIDYLNIFVNFIFNCNLMLNRCSVEPKVEINIYWCMPSLKTIWTTSLITMSESCY